MRPGLYISITTAGVATFSAFGGGKANMAGFVAGLPRSRMTRSGQTMRQVVKGGKPNPNAD
jgi:hypothetical protein